MNLLWRTKPASSRQHGQAEATELGVAVYAVAVVEEFSHDRADSRSESPLYSFLSSNQLDDMSRQQTALAVIVGSSSQANVVSNRVLKLKAPLVADLLSV